MRMASTPAAPSVDGDEPSLIKSILHRRKRFVLVTTAVCVVATLAATASQTKIYSSTSAAQAFAPSGQGGANGPNMATEVQIARSTAVAEEAAKKLNLNVEPQELLKNLGVVVPADSDVVDFTFSSPRPEDARKGAQAFANAYVVVRAQQFQNQTSIAQEATVEQIDTLKKELSTAEAKLARASGSQRTSLNAVIDSLNTRLALQREQLVALNNQALDFAPATVLTDAPLPKSPSKPNVPLNLILGLFGGLAIGFGIAALAEFLDDRVRGAKDLEARLGAPVLGVIPKDTREAPHIGASFVALGAPTSPAGDAFRRLSTNVAAAAAETGARSIAVTSVDRDDAPTELITNLAALLSAAGKRVVLVSMARRWPSLEETFGAAPGPGFLDALAGTVPIRSALAATDVENLLLCRRGRADLIEIGDGRTSEDRPRAVAVPSNAPSYALGSERTAELTANLGEPFDFVLVDAPALLGDADAVALARACDAVLTVATPETTRANIARAWEQLEQVRATLLGSVLIEVGGQQDGGAPTSSIRFPRESVMQRVKLPRVDHGQSSRR
jgi:capsular polysaccharide biosynthesis protein/Mrp family chromosome partitioning ATPase